MLDQFVPYFGYLATLLLAIGLLVSTDLKFRWFNTGGNVSFIIYGILLNAMPIILTNGILLTINIYYLYRIYNRKEFFELLEFESGGVMIDRFLAFYKDDIASYFPDFKREQLEGKINFVVLRDLVIANIFSADLKENGRAEVFINYTVPKYRDFKVGRFIFDKEKPHLVSKNVKTVFYNTVANPQHKKFLKVIGFQKEAMNGVEYFSKKLA
jgi:hypothetical protein